MDWNNIDLNNEYEASRNLLENYTFETLLLEIKCNVKEISPETVKKQALESINAKHKEALEILDSNLQNITTKAIKERNL